MHLVTLINDDEEYKRKALMSDWGNTRDKGNQWYGVEAVLTPMNKITEI